MRLAILFSALAAVGVLAKGSGHTASHDADGRRGRPDADTLVDLTVRVPAADLDIWDPINVNVNPIPWRVSGPARDNGVRTSEFRHQAIGARVRVEGIAWGYDVKTDAPKSRVLFEGGVVLIKDVDFNRPGVRGKAVRVEGTLRREAFAGHPGFERRFAEYYYIDATSFEIIDAVMVPEVVRLEPRS